MLNDTSTFDMNFKFINSDTNKAIKDMMEDQKEEWLRLIREGYVSISSTSTTSGTQIYVPSKLYSFSGIEMYQMPQTYITTMSTTTDTTDTILYTATTTSTTNATQYYLFTQNIVGTVQIEGDGCNIPAFEGDVEGIVEIED